MKKPYRPSIPRPGKDYTLNLPKGFLSWSQISKYLLCGEQYYRSYVLGEKEPTTPAQAEGTVMARVMERYNKRIMAGSGAMSLEAVKKYHHRIAGTELRKIDGAASVLEEIRERGSAFLDRLFRTGPPKYYPEAVESNFTGEIAGVPVVIIPDLVELDCVIDFKVVSNGRYYRPESSLQLGMYAYLLEKTRVGYQIFEKNTGKVEPPTCSDRLNPLLVEWIVARVAKGISQEVFTPCNPGATTLCDRKWCFFWDTCYAKELA